MQHTVFRLLTNIWTKNPPSLEFLQLQPKLNLEISQPVVAFSMKQRLSVAVQGLHRVIRLIALLCVVQCDEESSLLHSIQRLLVLPPVKELSTGLRPRHSADKKRKMQTRRKSLIFIIKMHIQQSWKTKPFFQFLSICLAFHYAVSK